jgi:hypothetical protein
MPQSLDVVYTALKCGIAVCWCATFDIELLVIYCVCYLYWLIVFDELRLVGHTNIITQIIGESNSRIVELQNFISEIVVLRSIYTD